MSWGLGWKRPSEVFNLALQFGDDSPAYSGAGGERNVSMEWTAGDDEDQVALRLQSKFMVAVPPPEDAVVVELTSVSKFNNNDNDSNNGGEDHNVGGNHENGEEEKEVGVKVEMKVVKKRDPLRVITMSKAGGSGQQSEGIGVLTRLLRSKVGGSNGGGVGDVGLSFKQHWDTVTVLSLCGCAISVL